MGMNLIQPSDFEGTEEFFPGLLHQKLQDPCGHGAGSASPHESWSLRYNSNTPAKCEPKCHCEGGGDGG